MIAKKLSDEFSLIHHVLQPLALIEVPSLKVLECNQHFERVTGLKASSNISEIFPKSIKKRLKPLTDAIFKDPGRYDDIFIDTADTSQIGIRVVDLSVSPISEGLFLVFLQDTTEKKNLERDLLMKHQELEKTYKELSLAQQQMEKTSRLTALGELAAGISHEVNQPLTGIRGFAQEMVSHLNSKEIDRETLKLYSSEVIKNVDRMSKIISHLKDFGRQRSFEKKQSDLVEVTNNALMLFGKQLSNLNVDLKLNMAEQQKFPVYVNPYEVEQVMINLISNAKDAVSRVEHPSISINISNKNDKIYWSISDNGCGIDAKAMSRIFEPFFTTKEVGKGMGLGLSISFSLLQQNGGQIKVKSQPGKGTEFTLIFEEVKK